MKGEIMTMFQKILAGAGAAILAVVLFGRETAAEWVEAAWRLFTTGAFAMLLAVGVLAGCAADGGYAGPERAIQGQVDTVFFDFNGMNTTYDKATELPLPGIVTPEGGHTDIPSTLKTRPDGTMEVTGPAVWLYGLAALCRVSNHPLCTGPLPN